MEDYRRFPEGSPLAWCPWSQKLVEVSSSVQVMRTVFYVHSTGVYPYVNQSWHEQMTTEKHQGA
ncbi:hypothetical protein LLE49_05260 [Alicyclobacillus tolerans]|uniref:hypothetical protein n=1 Tax=Alicyclobacillus tolerans TaxID=90970 RepID=UPI001F3EA2EA|nr:hypothetical protein [Alicyclobacillus tolerans]MCF8564147.1 hypothetical protein [Alicyclobacillus tolerans]